MDFNQERLLNCTYSPYSLRVYVVHSKRFSSLPWFPFFVVFLSSYFKRIPFFVRNLFCHCHFIKGEEAVKNQKFVDKKNSTKRVKVVVSYHFIIAYSFSVRLSWNLQIKFNNFAKILIAVPPSVRFWLKREQWMKKALAPNSKRLKIIFFQKIYRHFRLRKSLHLISPIKTFKHPEIWQRIDGLLMLKGRAFPRCIAINNLTWIYSRFLMQRRKKSYKKSLSSFLGQQLCLKKQGNKQYWIK